MRDCAAGHRHSNRWLGRWRGLTRQIAAAAMVWLALLLGAGAASALEGIPVPPDTDAIDLTNLIERATRSNDRIQVSTAPGVDGLVRRIEVRAQESGSSSSCHFCPDQ